MINKQIIKKYAAYIAACLIACVAVSCARSYNPDVKRGSTYQYKRGHPEVRLSSVGYLNDQNESFINITSDIVYGSLFYKREGEKRRANLTIELRVFDKLNDGAVITSRRFPFDQVVNPALTNSQEVFTLNRTLRVKPGKYEIELTVIDQSTNRRTTRVSNTAVPDPKKEYTTVTNIRMLGKQNGARNNKWFPITTYDIPAKLDSLKFVMRVNNKADSLFAIESRLVKFRADTSIATPMYAANYNPSDIAYKGINYNRSNVVASSRRNLIEKGGVTIEYVYPIFSRGNYRFKINAGSKGNLDLFKGRDFGIKSTNYPALETAAELARPLAYLMNDKEYERLRNINNSDTLKQAVDRFWLKIGGNQNEARSLLRLYYQRVEEANKRFSNFKEGWKTDRGMIFILFGTPYGTSEVRDELKWSYAYNRNDRDYNYTFIKARTKSEFFPFDYYRLQRRNFYYQRSYYQKQLWLTGIILVRRL